jgi:hypothetical protein
MKEQENMEMGIAMGWPYAVECRRDNTAQVRPVSRMGESAHWPSLDPQSMSGIERSAPSPGARTSSAVSCGHSFPSIKTHAVRFDTAMDQHP